MAAEHKLEALNFTLAGAREGFGPFLGVYLQAVGFDPAATGLAMSLAGLSGLLATTPIGVLVDRLDAKRAMLAIGVCAIAVGAVAIVATRSLWIISLAQALIGVGDTAVAPLVAALTLGIVGQARFGPQMARNEAFNHAGNAINAAIAALLGYTLGLGWVALGIVAMAVASTTMATRLRRDAIDHRQARSGEPDDRSTLQVLLHSPRLLTLALAVLLFQTANGALLPFLAQARTAAGGDPSITTGVMVVTARIAMVGAAIVMPRLVGRVGYGGVMATVLVVTALRCVLAVFGTSWAVIEPVEIMEGIATGLAGVAMPALSADIMAGSGRANAALGVVLTAFGAGCAIGPLLAGYTAQHLGFPLAFSVLGVVAGVGLAVWLVGAYRFGLDMSGRTSSGETT